MENESCVKENGQLKKVNGNILEKALVRKMRSGKKCKLLIGEVDQLKNEKLDAWIRFQKMEEYNTNLKIVIKNNCDEIVLLKDVIIKKDKVLDTILEENKIIKNNISDKTNILKLSTFRLRTTERNHYEFQLHTDLLLKKLKKKNRRLF